MPFQHAKLVSFLVNDKLLKEPLDALLKKGQQAYSAKQYDEAIRFFSQAIETTRHTKTDIAYLYELRSGAYVKLKKLDLAIQDAKQMIRLDKTDARGYIRCSQIEQFQNNNSSALRFLDHGLKHVRRSNPLFHQIEIRRARIKEAAVRNVIYEKGTDPIKVLPPELLEIVLSQLTYMDIVRSLRVCKDWKVRLSSFHILRNNLDFSEPRRKQVTLFAMNAALKRMGGHRKTLCLAKINGKAAKLIEGDLRRWINWERLESVTFVDESLDAPSSISLPWARYSLKSIEYGKEACLDGVGLITILQFCKSLERAVFRAPDQRDIGVYLENLSCNEKLRHLEIATSTTFDASTAWPFPGLQFLSLQDMRCRTKLDLANCINLKSLSLWKTRFFPQHGGDRFQGPPHLEEFAIPSDDIDSDLYPVHTTSFVLDASNLSKLHLVGSPRIINAMLDSLVVRQLDVERLTHLKLKVEREKRPDLAHGMTDDIPCPRCPNLKDLQLDHDKLMDGDFEDFTQKFPNVSHVQLHAPLITGVFIADLIRRPTNMIQSMLLVDCEKVSPDTLGWAQQRGVKIRTHRSNNLKLDKRGFY